MMFSFVENRTEIATVRITPLGEVFWWGDRAGEMRKLLKEKNFDGTSWGDLPKIITGRIRAEMRTIPNIMARFKKE